MQVDDESMQVLARSGRLKFLTARACSALTDEGMILTVLLCYVEHIYCNESQIVNPEYNCLSGRRKKVLISVYLYIVELFATGH